MPKTIDSAKSVDQACAVPFRWRNGQVRVCLITSSGGRWLFPKGFVEPGQTCAETALREAFEEAGLHGQIVGEPLCCYEIVKNGSKLKVVALPMEVSQVDQDWQESQKRKRRWVTTDEAYRLLSDSDLSILLDRMTERMGSIP